MVFAPSQRIILTAVVVLEGLRQEAVPACSLWSICPHQWPCRAKQQGLHPAAAASKAQQGGRRRRALVPQPPGGGLLPLEADRAGGQCQALLLVPVPCPLSCKAGTPSFPHQTKLQLGPLLRLPGAKTALVSVANSRWAVCVVLPWGTSFRPVPWVAGGSAPAGCITQDPLCWPWDFSSDKLEEEAYPLPGEEAGDMPPSGLQLVLLRGSHLLLLCSVQPRGLISVPPLVSWQFLCSFTHVELGPSGSQLDLEWIHSACVDPSS